MNISFLLDNINDKQRDAVSASRVNLLILAGAGSGKTRVIAHRIAWLQNVENCTPDSIMAVTFTNKAATEMSHRITQLIGNHTNQDGMWVGTFHGLAHRLLRIHYVDANLPKDFQILDHEDQLRIIRRSLKTVGINEKLLTPKQVMWYINSKKDKGIRPNHIQYFNKSSEKILQELYKNYQEVCDRSGLVDFSELILRTYELYLNKPNILNIYQERFTNVLVDEFQDTNNIQYSWIRLLTSKTGKVMIVGDDDQSIYGWRGAQVTNIQRFLKEFPNVKTIRLEQNYRSTNNILSAANALIEKNNCRLGKKLWTNSIYGEPISLYAALDELDEARFVIHCIKAWKNKGGQFKQCAILYRNNAQSRVLEEALLQAKIPYQIYGGIRFFERQEIKDVLAYLRLIVNRNDDAAFERIINIPTRGIGDTTLHMIRQVSQDQRLTLWQSSNQLLKTKKLARRVAASLEYFLGLIEMLSKHTANMSLDMQISFVIQESGLLTMYQKEEKENKQSRIDNLEELKKATKEFSYGKEENSLPLQTFLSHVTLDATKEKRLDTEENADEVQVMTLHSAKGLEFPQVFIVGMEEGMFPSKILTKKGNFLEEERRLAYVGITRAMQKLTLTYAKTRRLYGKHVCNFPSRFISDFPKKYIKNVIPCTKDWYLKY